MAKQNKKENLKRKEFVAGLKTETKHGIIAVVFFVLALFFLMSYFEIAGKAGIFAYETLSLLLGIGYILLPALFILLGISFIKSEVPDIGWTRAASGIMFLLSGLGIIDIASNTHAGGLLGRILSTPFVALFDAYASIIFLGAILIISILAMFDAKLNLAPFLEKIWGFFVKKKEEKEFTSDLNEDEIKEVEKVMPEEEERETTGEKIKNVLGVGKKEKEEDEEEFLNPKLKAKNYKQGANYVPPPLSLLEEDQGKPNTRDIKANANIIKRTLANFGIEVEMDEITIGPTVTRYALKPA